MHFAFQRNWGLKLWVALGLALWALVGLAQTAPQVLFKTSMGSFSVEVYPDKAPKTVDNFLRYVKDKHYDGTVFHRVMDGFMVQGGGFTADMKQKPTRAPVALEAMNGLKNEVGTIAMARTSDPNSATMSIRNEDGTPRFTADEVTGMFISMMFAGHHTTSGTAAWTLIELLRNPVTMDAVTAEVDGLFAEGGTAEAGTVSYQALREIELLESSLKEALRLHPPLILLLRLATTDLEVEGVTISAGKLVGASPAVSNRLPEAFPDAGEFVPERYLEPRTEDLANPWNWIPFGAGRHRCVGAAFAMMQLKAIFLVLLRDWEFELAQPPESYRNDHSKMVVQLAQPCEVVYRRRSR